jgi:hypothetical protein
MERSNEHESKKSKYRKTPEPKVHVPVVGSSCTWGDKELETFQVDVVRDVDVQSMIPVKFFFFDGLDGYAECSLMFSSLI